MQSEPSLTEPNTSSSPKITVDGNGVQPPPLGEVKKKTIELPEFCVFMPGENYPMKGFNFRFVGYTKDFKLVWECSGMTSKEAKRREKNGR